MGCYGYVDPVLDVFVGCCISLSFECTPCVFYGILSPFHPLLSWALERSLLCQRIFVQNIGTQILQTVFARWSE